MASDREATRYEIRGDRLYVNGEPQAVAAGTVAAAAALHRGRSKDRVDPGPGESVAIPEDFARLILRWEARNALRGLREELALALSA